MILQLNPPFPLHAALARAGLRYDENLSRARVMGATYSVRPGWRAVRAWMRGYWPDDGRSGLMSTHDLPGIDVSPRIEPSSDEAKHRGLIRLRNACARPGAVWRVENDVLFSQNNHISRQFTANGDALHKS